MHNVMQPHYFSNRFRSRSLKFGEHKANEFCKSFEIRCIVTSSRKLTRPVEIPRGTYEDPSLSQHLVFFYLDLPAKFCFAGTMHSVAASQDAFLHPQKSWHTI
jgi:hypothetical protein